MNWYRDEYDYMDDPPPAYFYRRRRPQYIPIPPEMDPIKMAEFVDRVHRRNMKAAEGKKKDDKKSPSLKDEALKYVQIAAILWFTAPFAAVAQHFLSTWITAQVGK